MCVSFRLPCRLRHRALYLLHADLFISALPLCSRPPTFPRCARTAIIDRTALFVARSANPPQFEDKIRENQRQDPKFSFLNPADPYHAYYRHRMDKVVQGELDEDVEVKEAKGEEKVEPAVEADVGKEPPPPEFILELPNISAIDLCVSPLLGRIWGRVACRFG